MGACLIKISPIYKSHQKSEKDHEREETRSENEGRRTKEGFIVEGVDLLFELRVHALMDAVQY